MSQPGVRAILLAIALLAGACGGSDDADAADPPATTPPSPTVADSDPEALVAALPDDARPAMTAVLGSFDALRSCPDLDSWTATADDAITQLEAATDAIEASAEADDWTDSEPAVALVDTVEAGLVYDAGCDDAGEGTGDARPVAGRISGAVDRLRSTASSGMLGASSAFWLNFDFLGHTIEIDRLERESEGVHTVIVGDSATKRGFDPLVLSDDTGVVVMNAATDGTLPSMFGPWLAEIEALGASPARVVMAVSSWTAAVPCDDRRAELLTAFGENRARAFVGVRALEPVDPARRVLGLPAQTYQSPLLDRYQRTQTPSGQGQYRQPDDQQAEVEAALADQQLARYRSLFADPGVCDTALAAYTDTVQASVESGIDVVMVAAPVSDGLAELHPDGRVGHESLLAPYADASEAGGATVLDLSDALDDDQFSDLVHPDDGGMATLTAALLDVLD
ncbi:MAG: hypothetical protein OES57_11240 [Acidimicrobiia bacterium]|nr:hypothetical protein [Acidimicrobiia bacterium]